MKGTRRGKLIVSLCTVLCAVGLLPVSAQALPCTGDVTLSTKNASFQTGDVLRFSAAYSYDGAPDTPGSVQYRPVTWTITNMKIGTCQYSAASTGLTLESSGNFTLLIAYNAYAYDSESDSYHELVGATTVEVPFTVTDSVIPNTIDITETGMCFAVMLIGIFGAILCIACLRKRYYSR